MRVANEEQASNVAPAGDHMRTGNVDCRERGVIHPRPGEVFGAAFFYYGLRCMARWPLRHAALPDDYR